MRNFIYLVFLGFTIASCNSPEPNSTTGNTQDSITVNQDTGGREGTGADNSGGTSGSGTLTDTTRAKTDTLSRNSGKGN